MYRKCNAIRPNVKTNAPIFPLISLFTRLTAQLQRQPVNHQIGQKYERE